MTTARESILDAYQDLLAVEGERHATVDAVAARAGVSKGGVLYHFPSKDRLAEALCERLTSLAAADAAEMRTAPEGPARYYVRSSQYVGTPLDRALVAVGRLQQAGHTGARAVIEAASNEWLDILHESLADLDVARAVKLIGDGLYYNALHGALGGHPPRSVPDEALLAVVDRMTSAPRT